MKRLFFLLSVVCFLIIAWYWFVPEQVLRQTIREGVGQSVRAVPDLEGKLAVVTENDQVVESIWVEDIAIACENALRQRFSRLVLVDRRDVTQLLRERKFQLSPYAEAPAITTAGQSLGAEFLFLIRVNECRYRSGEGRLQATVRLLEVKSGRLFWSGEISHASAPLAFTLIKWALFAIGLWLLFSWAWRTLLRQRRIEKLTEDKEERLDLLSDLEAVIVSLTDVRERSTRAGNSALTGQLRDLIQDLMLLRDEIRTLAHGHPDRTTGRDIHGSEKTIFKAHESLLKLQNQISGIKYDELSKVEGRIMELKKTIDEIRAKVKIRESFIR